MVGIGLRKDFAAQFNNYTMLHPDFIEVAPENWIGIGGFWKREFDKAIEKYPLFTHGLSLSIGGPDELDFAFLQKIKEFLAYTNATIYSEHLSFTKCGNAHLYELLPMPFTSAAVSHVAGRIKKVQDFLERRIAVEIVSYYSPIAAEMSEIEFIKNVVQEADCELLLDVNNVYVNSFNHNYDAKRFITELPLNKVSYIHMAGHHKVSDSLIIDTHGEAIIEAVYDLFDHTLRQLNRKVPVLLERDFNIPQLSELQLEIDRLNIIIQKSSTKNIYA